jgi:hypothetical protein
VDQPFKMATRVKKIFKMAEILKKSSLKAHGRIKCYIVCIFLRWSTATCVFHAHAIVLSNKITFPLVVLEDTWFLVPLQPMQTLDLKVRTPATLGSSFVQA